MQRALRIAVATFAVVLAAAAVLFFGRTSAPPPEPGSPSPSSPSAIETAASPSLSGRGAAPVAAAAEGEEPSANFLWDMILSRMAGRRTEALAARPPRVRAVADDRPVPGAVVRIRPEDDLRPIAAWSTDDDGIAEIPADLADALVVEVLAPGFLVGRTTVADARFYGRNGRPWTATLEHGVEIHGRVVARDSGEPIAGARVVVDKGRYGEYEVGPTDAEGRFDVPGVRDEERTELEARAVGYRARELDVSVYGGRPEPASATIELPPGASIRGTVRSAEGDAVVDAAVLAFRGETLPGDDLADPDDPDHLVDLSWENRTEARDAEVRAKTEADGSFQFDGLDFDRPYVVAAWARGHAGSPPVVLRVPKAGTAGLVDLSLRRPASLVVTLRADDGTRITGETAVRVYQRGFLRARLAPSEGGYRCDDLDPVPALVHVRSDLYCPTVRRAEISEGRAQELNVVLVRGATVEGVTVDVAGNPVEEATVSVGPGALNRHPDARYVRSAREATSDEVGRFRVVGVPAGPAVLFASTERRSTERVLSMRRVTTLTAPARDVTVVLEELGRFRVRIMTPDRSPFTGKVSKKLFHVQTNGYRMDDVFHDGDAIPTDGWLAERDLTDGRYEYEVRCGGFLPLVVPFEIDGGSAVELGERLLDPGIEISGRVVDRSGRPVAHAEVEIPDPWRSTETDEAGRFVLPRVRRGTTRVRVTADEFAPTSVDVAPEHSVGLEVSVGALPLIRLNVRHADGRAAGVTRLAVSRRFGEVYWDTLETDAEGRFEGRAQPGTYEFAWLDEEEGRHSLGTWTFAADENRTVELVLPAP